MAAFSSRFKDWNRKFVLLPPTAIGVELFRMKVPVKESDLMHLLGARIVRASGTQEGTLSLTFENGHEVKVFDDSADTESYRIATGAREIIV